MISPVMRKVSASVITAKAAIQLVAVIPAKAGIHFDLPPTVRLSRKHIPVFFHSPSWRAGHFSLLAQREVTKRKGTPAAAVAGLLPGDFVRTLRGSLTAHPCAGSERAGIVPAPLRAFPSRPHRDRGGPRRSKEADVLSAEADASLRSLRKTRHSGEGRNPALRFSFVS